MKKERKGKEEYLYSAILYTYVYLKVFSHESHSFICKYTMPAFLS